MRDWGVKRDHDCGRAEMGFEDCTLFFAFLRQHRGGYDDHKKS